MSVASNFKHTFLSTLSLRRATEPPRVIREPAANFYPRSPCGERQNGYLDTRRRDAISIHALLAESDEPAARRHDKDNVFLSTLSLRRATVGAVLKLPCILDFYPRSPCGERPIVNNIVFMPGKFLSTLSLRRATIQAMGRLKERLFLSTLSLRRATSFGNSCTQAVPISIHALLAESD